MDTVIDQTLQLFDGLVVHIVGILLVAVPDPQLSLKTVHLCSVLVFAFYISILSLLYIGLNLLVLVTHGLYLLLNFGIPLEPVRCLDVLGWVVKINIELCISQLSQYSIEK